MAVIFDVIRADEPRLRAFVSGCTVTFRGLWRCSCMKNDPFGRACKHVRAVSRELPTSIGEVIDRECERLGYTLP